MAQRDKHRTRTPPPKSSPALGNNAGNKTLILVASLAIIAVAVGLLYWSAIDAPLIYDDSTSITHNPSITRLWPLWGDDASPGPLNPPRETSVAGRPLVNLSLALDYHFHGLRPRGYHVTNLLIHLLSTCLLWAIVRRALRLPHFQGRFDAAADPLALAAALLWATHPLATEAVEYVTQRTELLMGFCYLATLYASLRYWAAPPGRTRRVWPIVATTVCAAGMACKEVMVTAPILVLLFDRTFVAGSFRQAFARSWPLYLGLSLDWGVLAALNLSAPRAATAGFHVGAPAHLWWFTQAKVLWLYLKLAIWPWPLTIHYDLPVIDNWQVATPWLVLTAIAGLVVLTLLAKNTASGFLLGCVSLILAPTLVVPIATEVAAERRMYLPLAALVVLVVAGGYALVQRLRHNSSATTSTNSAHKFAVLGMALFAVLLIIAFAGISNRRLQVYRDEVTLWQNTLPHAPRSVPVRMNLGLALINAGRPQEAIEQYEAVLQLEPAKAATHRNNLAYALLCAGRANEAIAQYEEALRADPDSAEAHNNLAIALVNMRRPREAIAHFRKLLELKPDYADGRLGLGMALATAGEPQAAATEFEELVRLQPNSVAGHARLAEAYAALDRTAAATEAAQRALALAQAQGQAADARAIESWLMTYRSRALAPVPGH